MNKTASKMLSYDEKVMKILNILIIESEMKVTYLKWLLKYFVSLFHSIYEHNMRLFLMIFVSSVVINHKNLF